MPDPLGPAVTTIAQSHTFTDLEKTLLFIILALFLAAVAAAWKSGTWVARVAFPELTRLAMLLVTGLADLKTALTHSDTEHTKRVDKLGVEVGTKVAGVGVKVDGLRADVVALSGKVSDLSSDVSRRLSGVDGAIDGMTVELVRSGSIPDAQGSEPQRAPTGSGLRAVRG